jgi:hypothetical protein
MGMNIKSYQMLSSHFEVKFMGSTDATPKETAADKLTKAILKSDPHLLAESWTRAVPASAPEATVASATKPAQQVEATAPAGKLPIKLASAGQDTFRQAVATEDQNVTAKLKQTIASSQSKPIASVLNDFDSLAQHVTQLNLTNVTADYNAIKNDPSKKPDAANELDLLHAHSEILANKAMVAYDAAFKTNADSGTPNRKQLIQIARQSMAVVAQDKDVAHQYAPRVQAYEGRVAAYNYAPPIGAAPTDSTPQPAASPAPAERQPPAGAPAPAERQPNPAAVPANRHDAAPQGPTDQQLAGVVNDAQTAAPAKAALEQQLWGAPSSTTSGQYLQAKADIFSITNGMANYTQDQQNEFQSNVFGPGTVQDKQKYIDTFAAKDKNLHDVATDLVKLGGDKVPTLVQWYNADIPNSNACAAFYSKAIAADDAGNQAQAATYWKTAQNYPLESTFASAVLQDPKVQALDAKMQGDSSSLFQLANRSTQAGDLPTAAKLYNESVQAADLTYQAGSTKAQQQLADAQKNNRTGDSLTADDKQAAAILRGPSVSRLNAAQGLNNLAAQYTAAEATDPKDTAALKQNATTLNQQAVNLLQDIPKTDPTYGGLTGPDLDLFKQTVSDGIAKAQKGEVIDPQASQKTFLTNSVVSSISDDANQLHLATVGPHPATATAVYGYDAMKKAIGVVPLVGGVGASFLPDIPFIPTPDAAQKQVTADLRDAKAADPVAAKKAIDEHSTDLKSTSVNGISTLVSAVVGPKLARLGIDALPGLAEKYLPEALQKVAPELPGWMKPAAYIAGGLVATVGTNEALQGSAHELLNTKMDSQGKILSESAAAYAAVSLANKIPLAGETKLAPVKFSGMWGNSVKALAVRGGVGFVPGAGVGLATHGPWSIDPNTGKPYTLGKTAASMGIDGTVTGLAAMLGPTIAQPVTNAARGLWSAKRTIVAAGAVNAVFGTGDSNPTQINPATGKHYTAAETGLASLENFGTGMAGGLAASKFLPWAGKFAASPLSYLAKGGQWLANKEAGQVTAEATEAAQKAAAEALAKGPGVLQRTGSKAIEIVNAPLTSRSKQVALGTIGVGNAAIGAIRANPSQINPETGEKYTLAETAETAAENFGIGVGVGYGGMKALNLSGQLAGKIGDIPVVQRAGSAIGGALERVKTGTVNGLGAARDGANSVRRYLGEQADGAVNYTQKHAVVQKLTPAATKVTERVAKITPVAPLVAAPVINKFLAPGSEYLQWKKADADSNKPAPPAPAPPAKH